MSDFDDLNIDEIFSGDSPEFDQNNFNFNQKAASNTNFPKPKTVLKENAQSSVLNKSISEQTEKLLKLLEEPGEKLSSNTNDSTSRTTKSEAFAPVTSWKTTAGASTQNSSSVLAENRLRNQTKVEHNRTPVGRKLKKSLECNKFGVRKFPGPAGLLPDEIDLNIDVKALMEYDLSLSTCKKVFQIPSDPLKSPAWLRLLKEENPSTLCTLEYLRGRFLNDDTDFSIDRLFVVIKSVDISRKHPIIRLMDTTDEMDAAVLSCYNDYDKYLIPGAALVLQNVDALKKKNIYYLLIYKRNILRIYGKDSLLENTEIKNVTKEVQNMAKRPRLMETQTTVTKQESFNSTITSSTNQIEQSICESENKKNISNGNSSNIQNNSKTHSDNVESCNIFEGIDVNALFEDF